MSMNHDSDAGPEIIGVAVRENKRGLVGTSVPTNMIRERLAHMLAAEVAGHCVKVTEDAYSTEYRVEVYVLTAGQLERLVQRRAERLYPGMPSVMEVRPKS
jgi:hypothetical protein